MRKNFLSKIIGHGKARRPNDLAVEGVMPEFKGIVEWINSPPLTKKQLAGKIVLIDFWTYSCINCVRTLPYLKAWHESYKDRGLVIVGIHAPEFDFEKIPANVKKAVAEFGLKYPVALDNDYVMWNAYGNRYWPAHYFVDGRGDFRHHHFGEGGYEKSEAVIRALLAEAGAPSPPSGAPTTVQTAVEFAKIGTPETYLGFDRMEHLGSPESVAPDKVRRFTAAAQPAQNFFYLTGLWESKPQYAVPREAGAGIVYRVRASKIHLVMEGAGDGIKADVRLDGKPVSKKESGPDVYAEAGQAVVSVKEGRMYTLVDTAGDYRDMLLEIAFRSPGAKVYAFTFG